MLFTKKASIVPPIMTEGDFLAVLRAVVVKRRLNPPQKHGYDPMAFSAAFVREGHFTGGPAFIRCAETSNGSGPICEACRFLTGKSYHPKDWSMAAKAIGLPLVLAEAIMKACELSRERDPALYHRILEACGLGSSPEDEEDLLQERRSA